MAHWSRKASSMATSVSDEKWRSWIGSVLIRTNIEDFQSGIFVSRSRPFLWCKVIHGSNSLNMFKRLLLFAITTYAFRPLLRDSTQSTHATVCRPKTSCKYDESGSVALCFTYGEGRGVGVGGVLRWSVLIIALRQPGSNDQEDIHFYVWLSFRKQEM